MGLIGQIFATLFGGDRNAVRELAEVFRVNAEAASPAAAGALGALGVGLDPL